MITEEQREKIRQDVEKMSPEEIDLEWRMITLVGTQEEAELNEKWKERIWKCPSCKFWFTIDWNHDDEVCCACAGCTVHPYLHKKVDCQCKRCVMNRTLITRYGKKEKE